jgi:hypothetical protein
MRQRQQIILGSLLGKGFISQPNRKNKFLTITESKNLDWLKYKAVIIDSRRSIILKSNKRFIWKSSNTVEWQNYHNLFYQNNKKCITTHILDQLFDEGLATWFLDKGCFIDRKICLRTTIFGLDGNQIIERYFNEVGMQCRIWKDKGTGKIVFSKKGSEIFLSTIGQVLPKFMYCYCM